VGKPTHSTDYVKITEIGLINLLHAVLQLGRMSRNKNFNGGTEINNEHPQAANLWESYQIWNRGIWTTRPRFKGINSSRPWHIVTPHKKIRWKNVCLYYWIKFTCKCSQCEARHRKYKRLKLWRRSGIRPFKWLGCRCSLNYLRKSMICCSPPGVTEALYILYVCIYACVCH
jgi:hypothetical protein